MTCAVADVTATGAVTDMAGYEPLGTASAAAKDPSTPEWQFGNSAPTPNLHAHVSP